MTTRTQVLLNTIAVIKAQTPPEGPEGADIGEEESIIEMEIRRR